MHWSILIETVRLRTAWEQMLWNLARPRQDAQIRRCSSLACRSRRSWTPSSSVVHQNLSSESPNLADPPEPLSHPEISCYPSLQVLLSGSLSEPALCFGRYRYQENCHTQFQVPSLRECIRPSCWSTDHVPPENPSLDCQVRQIPKSDLLQEASFRTL